MKIVFIQSVGLLLVFLSGVVWAKSLTGDLDPLWFYTLMAWTMCFAGVLLAGLEGPKGKHRG